MLELLFSALENGAGKRKKPGYIETAVDTDGGCTLDCLI